MPAVTRQTGLTEWEVEPIEAYDAATLARVQRDLAALDARYQEQSKALHAALDMVEAALWQPNLFGSFDVAA